MKKILFILALLFSSGEFVSAQTAEVAIIPKPSSLKRLKGEFRLGLKTKIVADDEQSRKSAALLNDLLLKNFNFKLEVVDKSPKKNAIKFLPASWAIGSMPDEAYGLNIAREGIMIAGSETGQFYALQTLMQILPVNFKGEAKLPALDITDQPRFPYRGMHLDVSRHFFPVEFVKKYIDLMAQYKFNKFHWHLTDDQGWRIEIKKYPKLTEIGSKRKESAKGRVLNPYTGDGVPVEGFYTQEQIKDVIAYAKARKITVIPEIELPGHSSAALAAYPNLGCKENYEYKVQTTWGIFKEVFCPKEETFGFLEDVLSEVIDLFPDSPYIHIGGDEVLKDFWKESPFVQELKAKENLKDEHEVQSYFVRRIEKFINSKGKKIIGWDEILEGGLAPNATVMSWRGMKGGIEAAKSKHDVIMTPTDFAYLDYGQGDPKTEPVNIGGYLPLQKVYSFEPVPKELSEDEKKYILGGQGNIWTEYLQKPENVEYMAFPRMLAISESVWSPAENKDFDDFQKRLGNQFALLDRQNVNYRIPEPKKLQNVLLTDTDKAKIELESPIPSARIFYTVDGNEPDENSTEYKQPFEIALNQNEKKELKTIVVTGNGRKSSVYTATLLRRSYLEPVGRMIDKYKYVSFAYYKSAFKSVGEMEKSEPTEKGTTQSIGLAQFAKKQDLKEPFGVIFDGLLSVPNDGIYEFQLDSDDGAILTIGDETIVDNDGLHSSQIKTGIVPLRKGFHRIRLKYIQGGGDAVLNLRWGLKGTGLTRISGGELWN
ncbi:MAG: family 20 glycosylhydrolase [Pyrinomonadaceae bacterium]